MMNHNGLRTFVYATPFITDKLLLLKEWNRAFLIPLAPGINDTELREEYFDKIMIVLKL
jgi:hypothetical protein